jgi:hypothetical protein
MAKDRTESIRMTIQEKECVNNKKILEKEYRGILHFHQNVIDVGILSPYRYILTLVKTTETPVSHLTDEKTSSFGT